MYDHLHIPAINPQSIVVLGAAWCSKQTVHQKFSMLPTILGTTCLFEASTEASHHMDFPSLFDVAASLRPWGYHGLA